MAIERTPPSRNHPKGGWKATYRDPEGNERSRTFRMRKLAEEFLTSVKHSRLTGTYVNPAEGKVSFRAYAEEWRKVQIHREGTATSVEHHLRLHVYPRIGDRPIGAIRTSEIQALVHHASQQLAPSTVHVVYGRMAAIFRAAVRDRKIPISPCHGIRLPEKLSSSITDVLSTEQVWALAEVVPARYRALVLTGAGLGLRPGELFGLGAGQVDFLRRTVRVDRQLVRVRADSESRPGVGLGPLKTKASYRTLPLPDVVGDALAAHLAQWPSHPELGVIFTTGRGGPVQQHPFAAVWGTAREKAGLPEWATPHDLRHYCASVMIRQGLSVKVIQARLGHASAKVTLDTYGHLFPDEEDRTRAAIDAELGRLAASTRPELAL